MRTVEETNIQHVRRLSLTHEMIASRVGARRAGITVAAGMLQEMNAIAYRRGRVHIENREALTRAVCECYNNMQDGFRSIAPPPVELSHYR